MHSVLRGKLPRFVVLFTLMAVLVVSLTACGGSKVKSVSLTCDNGAEVNISIDTTGKYKISVDKNVAYFSTVGEALGELLTADTANQLLSEHFGDATYSEMTINGGSAFGYEVAGQVVHIIPVDEFTYLCLKGVDNEAVYAVESLMTIEVVKQGSASVDDFARQVSQYGVGDVDVPDTNSSVDANASSPVEDSGEDSTEDTTTNP